MHPKKQATVAVPDTGRYYWVELAAIVAYLALFVWALWRLIPAIVENPFWAAAMAMSGYVAADFLSGFVHWAGDTWGSHRTPVIGPALISGFRDHHVDELRITRHDTVDTNGNNCLIAIPAMIFLVVVPVGYHPWLDGLAGFLLMTSMWTMVTNQIHKWAHLPPEKISPFLKMLQRFRIILDPDHHRLHHAEPYLSHYCITVGWLNPVLDGIGFFRGMERAIQAMTGAVPRAANGEAEEFGVYGEAIASPAELVEPEARASRSAAKG